MNNIPKSINDKRKLKLHNNPNHPICQMKKIIQTYFFGYTMVDDLNEVVTVKQNFDDLLIPMDHPARSKSDTYYINDRFVLRTHTSAHQTELLKSGKSNFLITGDVYRKDTIDKFHYPVFHQMEGFSILQTDADPLEDLKKTLSGLVEFLFPRKNYRFLDDYFPFTNPSLQIEVEVSPNNWMEILGGGVVRREIITNCGVPIGTAGAWAFGLGLDRLVMHKCSIPDIRYLWTEDPRFINQFSNGLTTFKEYSKHPSTSRDISFWTNQKKNADWEFYNSFCEQCRDIGLDLIEDIQQIDQFVKNDKISFTYRIVYRSVDRTLLTEEINDIQTKIRQSTVNNFNVELR